MTNHNNEKIEIIVRPASESQDDETAELMRRFNELVAPPKELKTHEIGNYELRQTVEAYQFSKRFSVPSDYYCVTDLNKSSSLKKKFRIDKYMARSDKKKFLEVLSREFDIPLHQLVIKSPKHGSWVHRLVMLDIAAEVDPTIYVWALQTFSLAGQGRLQATDKNDVEAVQAVEKAQELTQRDAQTFYLSKQLEDMNARNNGNIDNCEVLQNMIVDLMRSNQNMFSLLLFSISNSLPVKEAFEFMLNTDYFRDNAPIKTSQQIYEKWIGKVKQTDDLDIGYQIPNKFLPTMDYIIDVFEKESFNWERFDDVMSTMIQSSEEDPKLKVAFKNWKTYYEQMHDLYDIYSRHSKKGNSKLEMSKYYSRVESSILNIEKFNRVKAEYIQRMTVLREVLGFADDWGCEQSGINLNELYG